jgi:hypothetical protein
VAFIGVKLDSDERRRPEGKSVIDARHPTEAMGEYTG